jgi:hypothetical protein
LILDRTYPPIKPQALPVSIPVGESLPESGNNIVTATMKGNVPPDIGSQLITALSNQAKLVEVTELIRRIEVLENRK